MNRGHGSNFRASGFSNSNKIIVNAGSGRFGDGAGATLSQWEAAADFWKKLGYEVEAIPLGTL